MSVIQRFHCLYLCDVGWGLLRRNNYIWGEGGTWIKKKRLRNTVFHPHWCITMTWEKKKELKKWSWPTQNPRFDYSSWDLRENTSNAPNWKRIRSGCTTPVYRSKRFSVMKLHCTAAAAVDGNGHNALFHGLFGPESLY